MDEKNAVLTGVEVAPATVRLPDGRLEFADPDALQLDRSCVRSLDLTVLPLCALYYFLSFLDRSNIGNASVAGLKTDLKLTSHQYLVAITMTYILYIVAELPSNLLLKKIGPKLMIPAMVTAWGFLCVMTGLAQGYHGLLALRLFLGLVEGGLLPGLVLYLSTFYRRTELQLRMAFFFSATSLSGAFSGLLAAAIINMNGVGGQAGWRWIFFLEGIFTVLVGVASFFLLPSTPETSRFLSPAQTVHVARRLLLDVPPSELGNTTADDFSWREVNKALKSPHVLLAGVALFGNGCTLFSFSYFTPAIVATFKESTVKTQLLTVPPFVCAFVVTLLTAWWSDRKGRRAVSTIAGSALAAIGYIIFLTCHGKNAKYASLFLSITGVYGTAPALSTWVPNNSAPHYRKATAVAFGFVTTNSAGIMSTWLFPSNEAPSYRRGTIVNLSMSLLTGVFAFINLLYLMRANAQKETRKQNFAEGSSTSNLTGVEGDRNSDFRYTY